MAFYYKQMQQESANKRVQQPKASEVKQCFDIALPNFLTCSQFTNREAIVQNLIIN